MARTTTPKRKAAKPQPKLRGQRQPLSISLPPELVARIDAIAADERRSRANMIEIACQQFVESHEHRSAA